MTGNCGFAEGVIHLHGEACYQAGLAEGRKLAAIETPAGGGAPAGVVPDGSEPTNPPAGLTAAELEALSAVVPWSPTALGDIVAVVEQILAARPACPGDREANAYRVARRRLRHLHTSLAGQRQDWANNTEQPCSSARAVAYQSAMQSVHSIIDEIEAITGGLR